MIKIKTIYLFIIVIILFIASYFTINLKYDRLNRVQGINNDNRALIEEYLTDSEQNYLVENQIAIKDFIKYIEYDDFKLVNYRYYHLLEDTNRYSNIAEILKIGNSIESKLSKSYDNNKLRIAQEMIENDLEYGFISNNNFNDDYLTVYSYLRPLYNDNDDSYVDDAKEYIDNLTSRKYSNNQMLNFIKDASLEYNKTSLKTLLTNTNTSVNLISKPSSKEAIVNSNNYISSYEGKNLVLIQDISRIKYSMYLNKDAYNALKKMINDNKELKKLVIKSSFVSYNDSLNKGYDESQLGLTVDFTLKNKAYDEFENSDISLFLQNNAYKYGFILRYPLNKEDITYNSYNPHIYRYVGKKAAKSIYEKQIALEEYKK